VTTLPPRGLTVDGVELTVLITRTRVKNINARLRGDTLTVSAPTTIPERALAEAVTELARRLVRRVRAHDLRDDEGLALLARQVAARFPTPPSLGEVRFVTSQRARWGSYTPITGAVRLHAALREMPRWVLTAVLAHELAHAFHPDHSDAFWSLLRRVCPDADRSRAFLTGVSWLARRWDEIPPVERALLAGSDAGKSQDSGNS